MNNNFEATQKVNLDATQKISTTQKVDAAQQIKISERTAKTQAQLILAQVYEALVDKGYNPVNQIVGYILSGEPTYITGHKGARSLISKIERDELLEELVTSYLAKLEN